MSSEEAEEMKKQIQELCLCKKCPTWDPCAEEIGFCFLAIRKKPMHQKRPGIHPRAVCSERKIRVKPGYYCIIGPQKEKYGL